jgi:hypothetical protein
MTPYDSRVIRTERGIPERSYLDQRIQRSYDRMTRARSVEWAHRWADAFLINVRARNAMRTPAEIRQLERERGLR